jgi:3',5'-cyclic AMP phosphodiesterase CpdA
MLRFIQFSDIHIYCPDARWKPGDWISKRLSGHFNLRYTSRGKAFRDAEDVLERLVDECYARKPDLLIFSGDATALGVEEEFAQAAEILRVGAPDSLPAIAVPGNHDYYSHGSVAAGLFERYFAPWLLGERLTNDIYPYGRQLGDLYFVAVNTCKPGRWLWDSTGHINPAQLHRTRDLLAQPHVIPLPKILVTHYPLCLANGAPERRLRRLRNMPALLQVAQDGGVSLWIHGHRHTNYVVPAAPDQPIASVCVGSGTMRDHWSFAEYTFDGQHLWIEIHTYDPDQKRFVVSKKSDAPLTLQRHVTLVR